jgi:hypothetical protein
MCIRRFWSITQKHMRNSFSIFLSVAALQTNAARAAILLPIEAEDCSIAPEAVNKNFDMMKGYPLFLQDWTNQCFEPVDECPGYKKWGLPQTWGSLRFRLQV